MELSKELILKVREAKNICIITHFNPDGDAIGSSLGLYHFLSDNLHKKVTVITPNAWPEFLGWMKGTEHILDASLHAKKATGNIQKSDLIFILDFNSFKRIGLLGETLASVHSFKIMIDHHQQPENVADVLISDVSACSTCQLVYEFIQQFNSDKISSACADCLYTGIMTDTGSFRHRGTDARTHRIIADLIELGANGPEIHRKVYDQYSADRMRLLGYCLSQKMSLLHGDKAAFISLSAEELQHFNHIKGDTEGIVNYPLSISTVQLSVLLIERQNQIKLSFRSKGDYDVNQFARKYFNGGGHINASGAEWDDTLDNTILKLINCIQDYNQNSHD